VRSRDAGITWTALPLQNVVTRLMADAAPGLLYAVGLDKLYRSRDGGDHWTQSTLPDYMGYFQADPFQSGRLFAASFDDDTALIVWRSADGGTTWGRRGAGLPLQCVHYAAVDYCPKVIALTSDPRDANLVLLAFESFVFPEGYSESRVYRSRDGGLHWQRATDSPMQLLTLTADPSQRSRPGTFLAGTAEGVYRSADGGERWTPSGAGLPPHTPVVQLLWNGRIGAWYAATEHQGIFRSADGGLTWAPFAPGLPDILTPWLALDPRVPERLFAAVRGQGVWSWRPAPEVP